MRPQENNRWCIECKYENILGAETEGRHAPGNQANRKLSDVSQLFSLLSHFSKHRLCNLYCPSIPT